MTISTHWYRDFLMAGFGLFKEPGNINALLRLGDVIAETRWFERAVLKFKEQDFFDLMETKYSPKIPSLSELKSYQPSTLGHEYYWFIIKNNLDIYDRKIEAKTDGEWLRERSRRVHDFLHIILKRSTRVEDEICLNAYLVYSIGSPISCLIMYGGLTRLLLTNPAAFLKTLKETQKIKKWAQENMCLLALPWEELLQKPVGSLI